MSTTTCTTCGALYEAGSEEQANEPVRLCLACRVLVPNQSPDPFPFRTRRFTVRLVDADGRREDLTMCPGLPCAISEAAVREDNGRKLMPGYVRVQLAMPVAGRSVFYTRRENIEVRP